MLNLTAAADVNGTKFDGIDLFLFAPHVDIDASDDDLNRLADKVRAKNLVVGTVVAPVWPPTGGGSAMGTEAERNQFVEQVRKGCRIARKLREMGIRPYGVVRIDSAGGPGDWFKDTEGNQQLIAATFRRACDVAADFGERLAAEGEICWAGMHSWRRMAQLLELTDRPGTIGFQADMAHTLLYTLGYNAPEDRILPENWNWSDPAKLDGALASLTAAPALHLDDRFSHRPERRHGERFGLARQDGPALSAERSERQTQDRPSRGLLDARFLRQPHEKVPPHLLGRLHVPQRRHEKAADVE